MKIKRNVIDKYTELCWISANKCESVKDVEDKIVRAVNVGKLHRIEGKDQKYIMYYNLCFVVQGNEVVDIFKDQDHFWFVKENVKKRFDRKYQKIVV